MAICDIFQGLNLTEAWKNLHALFVVAAAKCCTILYDYESQKRTPGSQILLLDKYALRCAKMGTR